MAIDLIFSQSVARNPAGASRSDQTGPCGSGRSAGSRAFAESPESESDNFLNTLKQVTQDRNPAGPSESAAGSQLNKSSAAAAGGKINDAAGHETAPAENPDPTQPDEKPDPMANEWNLTAFLQLLERLGFSHATEDGFGLTTMADAHPADNDLITAVETLITRLQQYGIGMPADLKAGLEQLQQFIAAALGTGGGVSGQGLSPNQLSALSQIHQWLNGLTGSLQAQKAISGLPMAEGPGDVNASSATAAEAAGSGATALKSQSSDAGASGPTSLRSTEQSAVLPQSESRRAGDPNLATDSQPLAAKNDHDAKAAQAVENAAAEASKTKDPMAAGHVARRSDSSEVAGRMAPATEQNQAGVRQAVSLKPDASSGPDPTAGKGSESQIQSAGGSEPLSKVFQEAQLVKEGGSAASGALEETVGKVIKIEAAANDNGLLNSSDPNLQKTAETAAVQKEIEAGQNAVRNQTLDQIVRQGAIHLRNGQHEARIDLKPDFLGHIRMQVISANHQVTVKILAEHGFVKDMIESNIHQLKADLQQQGLTVDKLEVTVSRDADDSGNDKNKFAQSRARPGHAGHQSEEHAAENKQRKTGQRARAAAGAPTVDYFA